MADSISTVKGTSKSKTGLEVNVRGFNFIVDEPPSLSGNDEGPTPVEYVLAGLIGCLNVVAHLLAKERNISFEELHFDASGRLDPGKLLGQSEENRAGFKDIAVKMHVKSLDADEETLRKWLQEVKARCPVSDNLGNSTPIEIEITR